MTLDAISRIVTVFGLSFYAVFELAEELGKQNNPWGLTAAVCFLVALIGLIFILRQDHRTIQNQQKTISLLRNRAVNAENTVIKLTKTITDRLAADDDKFK